MSDEASVRIEHDPWGEIEVDARRLWGAQTERNRQNFDIGRAGYVWGRDVICALGLVKKAAAHANHRTGVIDEHVMGLIVAAADEVIAGRHDAEFPLTAFQTGSGTHTNMNVNEVIANRANQIAGAELGAKAPVHPNDHVNASQSSNDVIPTVMHVAVLRALHQQLFPPVAALTAALDVLAANHSSVVKVGRTHLQDATPITLGQEIAAWSTQIRQAVASVRHQAPALQLLAMGGTATGTGLNAPVDFGRIVAEQLTADVGLDFIETDNHFTATSAHDAIVNISAALRTLAGALMKMANDIRLLSSGPRNGIGEIRIPANEPGSSIMPGKTNPSQAEALNMVVARVFGNDATIAFAGMHGEFQLNVYKPIMLHATLDSITLLAESIDSFTRHCVVGLEPNDARILEQLDQNLMVVTALVPQLGYDAVSAIAKLAVSQGLSAKQAVTQLGYLTADEYDRRIDLLRLATPHETDEPPDPAKEML